MPSYKFKLNALLLAMLASPAFADDAVERGNQSIEKIVVLGEKTEKSLKDVSSSVSVITEEQLKTLQYLSVHDAISEIPNLVVLSGQMPNIRGVSGNGAATGFSGVSGGAKTRVSTITDGVAEPFMADLTGDTGMWDIEQIEVFRGPQSTSNGRNSIGGAMFIKTKDPTFDWQGAARVGYRSESQYIDSAAAISGPLIEDELAFRLSAQHTDGETYANPVIHEANPPGFDLNKLNTDRIRAKLLWEPAAIDGLKAMLSYAKNHERGNTGRQYFSGDDPWKYQPINPRNMDTESDTGSIKLDYRISDNFSVDFLLARMNYNWVMDTYDKDPATEQVVSMEESNTTAETKLHFGLNSELYSGFIGLYYFKRDQGFNSIGGSVYRGDDNSDSKAVIGEFTYNFTDDFRITAGGRVERESQLRNFWMKQPQTPIEDTLDNSKTIKLPKLVLQYDINAETTVSLSGRRGYNAAGAAIGFPENEFYFYDEEYVNAYELGLRTSLDGGNINLSANLFYNDYDGYQATGSARRVINMDKVITYGAEFEASAMVTRDLRLHGGLGLLSSEIKEPGEGYASAKGNELDSAPSMTANLGAQYWLTDQLTFSVSANYVGEYYGDFENTEERVAGDYVLARMSLNYETDNWIFNAFVNNAFDEKAVLSRSPAARNYPDGYAAIVDPRNFGVSVTYQF